MEYHFEQITEKTLNFLANKEWKSYSNNILDAVVIFLGETFEMDYVFLDKYSKTRPLEAETLAIYSKGEFLPNVKHHLHGTPCENVIGCKLCCYETNVQELFPKDHLLKEMNVNSYMGIPLWSSTDEAIGLIALLDNKPIANKKVMEICLKTIAIKAAHELEKQIFDNELLQKNTELQDKYNDLTIVEEELRASHEELLATSDALKETNVELQRQKEKAEENEKTLLKLANVIENSLNEIYIFKENSLKFEYLNKGALRNIGYSPSEINELTPIDIKPEINDAEFNKLIEPLRKRQKDELIFTTIHQRKNKTTYPVEVHLQFIRLKDENLFLAVINDITERLYTENELIKAKEKAEESDRLKTSFLNNMSHEVRTPLNAIVGFSKLMANSDISPEKAVKFAQVINKSSNKLIEIITDVIEISQIQAKVVLPNYEETNILPPLRKIVANFEENAKEKKLNYNFTCSTDKIILKTDVEKLSRIVSHLLDNAIKFTKVGSVEIIAQTSNKQFQLTIKDTGIGISKEMQQLIFEPFRQVETGLARNYGGNGLGLAIVKTYLELINGKISLTSALNKGTEINIFLPVETNSPQQTTTEEKVTKENAKHKTILIAEDEYSNYQFLLELLELIEMENELIFDVLYAENGQEAIDICRNNAEISLIIMDIKMPLVDGHTAACIIKQFRPETPILAQSAFALDSEKEKYRNIFDAYITKPINMDEFQEKMAKLIGSK